MRAKDEPGIVINKATTAMEGNKTHYLTVYSSTVTMMGSLPGSHTI